MEKLLLKDFNDRFAIIDKNDFNLVCSLLKDDAVLFYDDVLRVFDTNENYLADLNQDNNAI